MNLSAFTSFIFKDDLAAITRNIEIFFSWFSLSKGSNLQGKNLSRSQVFELMAAAHGYKSYASFKNTDTANDLTKITTDFKSAVASVMNRMDEVIGTSNEMFAKTLVGYLLHGVPHYSDYAFKSDVSNLLCYFISNFHKYESLGLPMLTHIYLMALNDIGLSIGLEPKEIELNKKVHKHVVVSSKSLLTDLLRFEYLNAESPYTVNADVKLADGTWVKLCNKNIGSYIAAKEMVISNAKGKKHSISKDLMIKIRDAVIENLHSDKLAHSLNDSKLELDFIRSDSLVNVTDFLEQEISYSFSEKGEKGVYVGYVDSNTVEFIEDFAIGFKMGNSEHAIEIVVFSKVPTIVKLDGSGLNISPEFIEHVDSIMRITIKNYQDHSAVNEYLTNLHPSYSDLNAMFGSLSPNMRKLKYLYACAFDNVMSLEAKAA